MPELPEVETLRRTLHGLLIEQRITGFELLWHRTIDPLTVEDFETSVVGQTIKNTRRRGKLLILDLDDGASVTIHLRMTGELLFRPDATLPRAPARESHLRAVFGLSDKAELCFYDTRKFGRIALISPENTATHPSRLGIEPLSEDFTVTALASLLRRRRAIKPLLLDQSAIAGLGNIYVDEILFRSGVHPLQPAEHLSNDQVGLLHRVIVEVLNDAIEHQGTTFSNYRSGLGEPGSNQERLQVYGRPPGAACLRCEGTLERLVVGQRGTILCPTCQPLMPGDRKSQSSRR